LTSREEQVEASSTIKDGTRKEKDEQEEKKPKKSSRIESMMEKCLEMRTK
jgi:hypothetical protein